MRLKKTLTIVLAIVIFSLTFLIESAFSHGETFVAKTQILLSVPANQSVIVTRKQQKQTIQGKKEFSLLQGDILETESATDAEVRFSETGLVRLGSQSAISVLLRDSEPESYILRLIKGRMWANNLYASSTLNILAGNAYLLPQRSIFDVSVDDEKTLVYAHKHALIVGLVRENFQTDRAGIPVTDVKNFINSYLLPQGSQTIVYSGKVAEQSAIIQKLLYSKLVKEFPVSVIDPEQLGRDHWFQKNTDLDNKLLTEVGAKMLRYIRDRGLKVAKIHSFFYELGGSGLIFGNTLTFSDAKVVSRLLERLFDSFYDSQYLFVFGRLNEGEERLSFFKNLLDEATQKQNPLFREKLLGRLWREYQAMNFVGADEPLYSAKNTLTSILFTRFIRDGQSKQRLFQLLHDVMNNVYDLAGKSPNLARQALDAEYFKYFNMIVSVAKGGPENLKNLFAEENQVMDNLLRLYPEFYRDNIFDIKNRLEQEWLKLLPDGNDKNETKQTVIGNKIDFLRRLKDFFLQDKIPLDDTRRIVFRLFREAEDLQMSPAVAVAVNELFTKRLESFGVFFRFLNSPEYVSTPLYGATRQEQFNQFLAIQKKTENPTQFSDLSKEIKAIPIP